MKKEQGSVTLFILTIMLFSITVLMLSYINQLQKVENQKKEILELKRQYSIDRMHKIYEQAIDSTQETNENFIRSSER